MCDVETVDSRESAGAPDAEIEVTTEMIEAGIEAYCLWDRDDPTEWKVADIFRQMAKAKRESTAILRTALVPMLPVERRRIANTQENGMM
jgi:hypothetical protein